MTRERVIIDGLTKGQLLKNHLEWDKGEWEYRYAFRNTIDGKIYIATSPPNSFAGTWTNIETIERLNNLTGKLKIISLE